MEVARGATVLVARLDDTMGVSAGWTENTMCGWRRGIGELDGLRRRCMLKINVELRQLGQVDPGRASYVKSRLACAMLRVNRDVDAYVSKRVVVAGYDSMDQIVVDSTIRRLHYHIDLGKLALELMGLPTNDTDLADNDPDAKALLFLARQHVARARLPLLKPMGDNKNARKHHNGVSTPSKKRPKTNY